MSHNLIKKFEGLRLNPYLCPAGFPTIGYGTITYLDGRSVSLEDAPITEYMACILLEQHINKFIQPVITSIKIPLNCNEREAIESFIYNVGTSAFLKSTLLKCLNSGKMKEAAKEFLKWDKATVKGKKIVLPGLTKRRQEEAELFLTPAYKNS